ncbi:MAG: hypothetical protein HY774_16315 [Acidobacteria bacterium]|nr:hypothetical protein [Acidobacteriota bacterium]
MLTRRWFLAKSLCLPLLPVLPSCIVFDWSQSVEEPAIQKFTPAPGDESPDIKAALDTIGTELKTSKTTAEQLLTDSKYMDLHPWPRFRELIREFGRNSHLTIVSPDEPGIRLSVTCAVIDAQGKRVPGAQVYLYHTNSQGLYARQAAHISAMEGDRRHARLFGYLRTDQNGIFSVQTIRPAGYPGTELPAHIHVEIKNGDSSPLITEIRFEDDPRLTPALREQSIREGFRICSVVSKNQSEHRVETKFQLR